MASPPCSLATPPLQKTMGDFLQAHVDRGDIREAGGRLRLKMVLMEALTHLKVSSVKCFVLTCWILRTFAG